MKKQFSFFLVAFVVLVIDQALKYFISSCGCSLDLSFVSFHFVKNVGVGFGLLNFPGLRWLLVVVTIVIIIGIIYYYCRLDDGLLPVFSFGLVLGGALGNLIDRMVYGFVTDFIDLGFWPAFNIADSAVTVGIILLILFAFRNSASRKIRKNRKI